LTCNDTHKISKLLLEVKEEEEIIKTHIKEVKEILETHIK
jgi:hypothetical protein